MFLGYQEKIVGYKTETVKEEYGTETIVEIPITEEFIASVADTREELENNLFVKYTRIEETSDVYELVDGVYITTTESFAKAKEQKRAEINQARDKAEQGGFEYMGKVFEEICKQYLWRLLLNGESPVEFKDLGRWWGTDPAVKSQAEIDIMGDQDGDTALFGECKWTKEKVDTGVLETLAQRSRIFHYRNVTLYLFARKGFTEGCRKRAQDLGNVELVTYEEMLKEFEEH